MVIALAIACILLAGFLAADFLRARRKWRPSSTISTIGLRLSFVCPDCSGSLYAHDEWCGKIGRSHRTRDEREVRKTKHWPLKPYNPAAGGGDNTSAPTSAMEQS